MKVRRDGRLECGMTLMETIVAIVVFGIVTTGALATFRSQSQAFTAGNERIGAIHNGLFAADMLEQDLRATGSGTLDAQPYLVYAGADVIAINANLVTNVAGDVFAVYSDADAPSGTVTALTRGQRITIPNSSFAYPDTSYSDASGINSPAETVILFFTPDSSTSRADDYALFRQVNRDSPELVARNLLHTGTVPFLQYYRLVAPAGQPQQVAQVAGGVPPLAHSARLHLSAADTGAIALIDSLRGVRVSFTVTNGRTGSPERLRALTRLIRLPNAGLAQRRTCGDEPILGSGLGAALTSLVTGEPAASLTWSPATDETGGEKDVVRYVIWRRKTTDPDWGEPYLSIPAGTPSYEYTDAAVTSGASYRYALAAQDCTPSLSGLATSGAVTIP